MNPLLAPLLRWFGRLRYPHLMLVVAGLFVVDLLVPDMIPLVDELLFGLGTVALAKWKNHEPAVDPAESDQAQVNPPRR